MKRCQLFDLILINDVLQFKISFHAVVLNIKYFLGSLIHLDAVIVELFDAIQHASYLLY